MIGIVIATHGELSLGLKDASEVIFGEVKNIETACLLPGQDVDLFSKEITKSIDIVNKNKGVFVFVDIAGASPYNQTLMAINSLEFKDEIHVITGVNLPMVMEAVNQQLIDSNIEDAKEAILKTATNSVKTWNSKEYLEASNDEDDF